MLLMEKENSSVEEVEAYDALCAMVHGPLHHRLRMRKVALRSRYPELGRALPGGLLHLRLDEFGNPEILQNKKLLVARFVPNGMRVQLKDFSVDRKTRDLVHMMLRKYCNFQQGSRGQLVRADLDKLKKKQGNLQAHELSYAQGVLRSCPNKTSACSVCNHVNKVIPMIEAEIRRVNDFDAQYIIKTEESDDGAKWYPFVPYFNEENENIIIDMTFLPSPILDEWEKVKNSRDWIRRGRGKTQQPIEI